MNGKDALMFAAQADDSDDDLVFVTHSRDDLVWAQRFRVLLEPLVQRRRLRVWDGAVIRTSGRWHPAIEQAIERSRVAVVLVSRSLLASTQILHRELPWLRRHEAAVQRAGGLSPEAARALAGGVLGVPGAALPPAADRALAAVGHLPLAVVLLAAAARTRQQGPADSHDDQPWETIAADLARDADIYGTHPYATTFRALTVAVAAVPAGLGAALPGLAVFGPDTTIPITAVARYWAHTRSRSADQTADDLARLADAHLVRRDGDTIGISGTTLAYLLLHADALPALQHSCSTPTAGCSTGPTSGGRCRSTSRTCGSTLPGTSPAPVTARRCASWSPIRSITSCGSILVWSMSAGELVRLFASPENELRGLDDSGWRTATGGRIKYGPLDVAWSPDGVLLTITDTGSIWTGQPRTDEVVCRPHAHTRPASVATWSPDGMRLATGHRDGVTRIWLA
jgi:hypothetical protein